MGKYEDLADLERDFIKIDALKNVILLFSLICDIFMGYLVWLQWFMLNDNLQHELIVEGLVAIGVFVLGFCISQRQGYWKATLFTFLQQGIILTLIILELMFTFQWHYFEWHPYVFSGLISLVMFVIVDGIDVAYSQAYQLLDAHLNPRRFG